MSAVRKVEFSQRPEDVFKSLLDETSDFDKSAYIFAKRLSKGQTPSPMLVSVIVSWGELVVGGKVKMPKPVKKTDGTTEAEKTARALERQARRVRLAGQVDAIAEKRALMKFIMPNGKPLGECTMGYVGSVGGQFAKLGGKPSDKRIFSKVRTERDLEKAKII